MAYCHTCRHVTGAPVPQAPVGTRLLLPPPATLPWQLLMLLLLLGLALLPPPVLLVPLAAGALTAQSIKATGYQVACCPGYAS